jgi:hypothetical protein
MFSANLMAALTAGEKFSALANFASAFKSSSV